MFRLTLTSQSVFSFDLFVVLLQATLEGVFEVMQDSVDGRGVRLLKVTPKIEVISYLTSNSKQSKQTRFHINREIWIYSLTLLDLSKVSQLRHLSYLHSLIRSSMYDSHIIIFRV